MNEPLTVSEVRSLASRLRRELTGIPLGMKVDPRVSYAIGRAQATVDELLLLCEFVDDCATGRAVVVDDEGQGL